MRDLYYSDENGVLCDPSGNVVFPSDAAQKINELISENARCKAQYAVRMQAVQRELGLPESAAPVDVINKIQMLQREIREQEQLVGATPMDQLLIAMGTAEILARSVHKLVDR
ncbi:MAG: hypothetical protein ABFR47_08045 [Verrucomicrobiota bacterium]